MATTTTSSGSRVYLSLFLLKIILLEVSDYSLVEAQSSSVGGGGCSDFMSNCNDCLNNQLNLACAWSAQGCFDSCDQVTATAGEVFQVPCFAQSEFPDLTLEEICQKEQDSQQVGAGDLPTTLDFNATQTEQTDGLDEQTGGNDASEADNGGGFHDYGNNSYNNANYNDNGGTSGAGSSFNTVMIGSLLSASFMVTTLATMLI